MGARIHRALFVCMKFIDEIAITIKSGHGGPGKVSFRREKSVPRGGPDGGDGGKGGDVIFQASPHLKSLLDYHARKVYSAENGQSGDGQMMTGAYGQDLILQVPPGTIVKTRDGEILADLDSSDARAELLKGGRGGKGNSFFKTSINQAPMHAQPGEPGESKDVILELKLLANIGIVGFPNAGKSTLISRISAARPKIADYPFTTLVPNLGVVRIDAERSMVVADIPGLIPGAHKGIGLGIRFLKHVERTSGFIHLIDASGMSGRDPLEDYTAINIELKEYDNAFHAENIKPLSERPQLVVLNKIDALPESDLNELVNRFKKTGVDVLSVSAVTGQGIRDMVFKAGELIFGNI